MNGYTPFFSALFRSFLASSERFFTVSKWVGLLRFHHIPIKLKLDNLAQNLIVEEHPTSKNFLTENKGKDKDTYPGILDTEVYSIVGIGRFYLGLAQHIEIIKAPGLKEYAKDYLAKALS